MSPGSLGGRDDCNGGAGARAVDVTPRAFYTVADGHHFIGAVALLNSLRLTGHAEPVGVPPVYMAPLGPLARAADVARIIDADIIVLRPLTQLVESAARGRVVRFVNDPPNHERFFPDWAARLGLGVLRRRPYLNAGLFVLPRPLCDRLLGTWLACQEKIDYSRTRYFRIGDSGRRMALKPERTGSR